MKEMDKDGLLLCQMQANIFVMSLQYTESSSEIFIRRFMNSNIAKEFDSSSILNDSINELGILKSIENEYGKTSYGKKKYSEDALYWIGYLYRYMSYIYDISSKQAYKIIKEKELNLLFYSYHTLDCKKAIDLILESKNVNLNADNRNKVLLDLIKKHSYEENIKLIANSNVLLIEYKDKIVGKVNLNKQTDSIYLTDIQTKIENNQFKHVLINKIFEYIDNQDIIKQLNVKVNKNDIDSIKLYKKNKFSYFYETDDYCYYYRKKEA